MGRFFFVFVVLVLKDVCVLFLVVFLLLGFVKAGVRACVYFLVSSCVRYVWGVFYSFVE